MSAASQSEPLGTIQKGSLELLVKFDEYCKAHGFRWFLGGGTLLGAARHQGFIPWDDDIDVIMLRKDYDAFVAAASQNTPEGTYWESMENCLKTPHANGRFCSTRDDIVLLEMPMLDVSHSLGLDVFAYDDLPNGAVRRYIQSIVSYACRHLALLVVGASSPKFRALKNIMRMCVRPFVSMSMLRKVYRRNAVTGCGDTGMKACICGKYSARHERFRSEWFDETVELPFCGLKMPAPKGYCEMLRVQFGESYMTPVRFDESHYRVRDCDKSGKDVSVVLFAAGAPISGSRLIASLSHQTEDLTFELVMTGDASDSDRQSLEAVLPGVNVCYVSEAATLSDLMALACGKIVTFAEPDCEYSPYALSNVKAIFESRVQMDALIASDTVKVPSMVTKCGKVEPWRQFYRRCELLGRDLASLRIDDGFAARMIKSGLCVWRDSRVLVEKEPAS